MKKLSLKWIVVCCGLLFTTTASAQLGNLLGVIRGRKPNKPKQKRRVMSWDLYSRI